MFGAVNRRGFLGSMLQAGVAAMFLPKALTYARAWKKTEAGLLTPVRGECYTIFQNPRLIVHGTFVGAVPEDKLMPLSNIQFGEETFMVTNIRRTFTPSGAGLFEVTAERYTNEDIQPSEITIPGAATLDWTIERRRET